MANAARGEENDASTAWDASQEGYLHEPHILEFETRVLKVMPGDAGRKIVTLERTYFYPTAGGQDDDTGWLGEARVLAVRKPAEGKHLLHIVEGDVGPGVVKARIDADRRQRHMQNHTAQHLLSACFIQLFGRETLSARIKGYAPSTLDLPGGDLSADALIQAEELANRVIFQNLPVRTVFLSPQELEDIPLRNPPKVKQHIRIVEIEGFDYAPCGGTHCSSTAQIGVLKILKTEHVSQGIRVHFTAGRTALEIFQGVYQAASSAAAQLSVGVEELPQAVERQSAQLKTLQRQWEGLRRQVLAIEAQELLAGAQQVGNFRLVSAAFEERPAQELRQLSARLSDDGCVIALLVSRGKGKASVVLACPSGSPLAADDLLRRLLKPLGGKGGGDSRLAQGGMPLGDVDWQAGYLQLVRQLHQWLGERQSQV